MKKYTYVYLGTCSDYYKYIREQLSNKTNRVVVSNYVLNNMNFAQRFLYKVHTSRITNFFFNLPLKGIWSKFFLSKQTRNIISKRENVCFCIHGLEYIYAKNGLIKYLRHNYPNSKIVLILTDIVAFYNTFYKGFKIDNVKQEFDFVFSFNPIDVCKYNLCEFRPCVIDYDSNETDFEFDVFFIGRNKNRLNEVCEVARYLTSKGYKLFFYLVNVPLNSQIHIDGLHYGGIIPYSEVINYVKKSKCILNIYQKNSDGITLRDNEAIGLNKVLITNGEAILSSCFFTDEKIIRLDNLKDELYKIDHFNQNHEWNGKKEYSIENFYNWFDEVLNTKG